ncbi:MAG: hypothetical protein QFX35_03565 [Candidatus Verstraetearchaeota archaeon]|nr:hypothetical protein [Candidatus Verstraetearchaeota archaeon]
MGRAVQKGVSEVVATLALLVITLTAMAIYIQGFNLYYSGETGLISGIFRSGTEQNYERISIAYIYYSYGKLYLLVYNYGARDATVEKVIIDTRLQTFSPAAVPVGGVTRIEMSVSLQSDSSHVVSLITERNNVVSTEFRVG